MSVLVFPANVIPRSVNFYYGGVSSASISPLNGASTILAKPGDRWWCDMDFDPIFDTAREELIAFAGRLRQQTHSFMLPPFWYRRMGSFNPPNLAPNGGTFDTTTSPWTTASSTISINGGMLKVKLSIAANGAARSGGIAVTPNVPHLLTVDCIPGNVSTFSITIGSTPGAGDYGNSGNVGPGYTTLGFTPTASPIHVALRCQTATPGDFVFFDNLTIHQAAQVVGSTPIGDTVVLDGLPVSTNGLIKKGGMIEINSELKMLEFDLDSDSSGVGFVRFGPPLREAVADNTYVNLGNPRGRFYLTNGSSIRINSQKFFQSGGTIQAFEDIGT